MLGLRLTLPFLLKAEAQHERLECVHAKSIQLNQALIVLDSCITLPSLLHPPLQLVYVVFALNLAEEGGRRLQDYLVLVYLTATVFISHCSTHRGHQLSTTNSLLLFGKVNLVKDWAQRPIYRFDTLLLLYLEGL